MVVVGDPSWDDYLVDDEFHIEDDRALAPGSPVEKTSEPELQPELVRSADLMVVSGLCGWAYFGLPRHRAPLLDEHGLRLHATSAPWRTHGAPATCLTHQRRACDVDARWPRHLILGTTRFEVALS